MLMFQCIALYSGTEEDAAVWSSEAKSVAAKSAVSSSAGISTKAWRSKFKKSSSAASATGAAALTNAATAAVSEEDVLQVRRLMAANKAVTSKVCSRPITLIF
jgi:hypothetical protein